MKTYFPGIADENFSRGDVPMTKQEVRTLALAKAKITETDTIIDIGAGTGSLSVEAALQAKKGRVFAIEREAAGIELIRTNAEQFDAGNIVPLLGVAPDALTDLPQADVIFIGGNGGRLPEILVQADALLKAGGRLVAMAITVETLYHVLDFLRGKAEYEVEACGVQITRIRPVGASHMLQALNPVYIIVGTKGDR
jgi:precorrin-6Y C5,15-methyltransferase (decarboxylating) CbiT subunit